MLRYSSHNWQSFDKPPMKEGVSVNIIVMAKPPTAGEAKTRLSLDIGQRKALVIYKDLLEQTLRAVESLPIANWLVYTYGETSFTKTLLERGFDLINDMRGCRLAEKVHHAFEQSFKHAQRSIMIVSDDYLMSVATLTRAIRQLSDNRVVIGPTIDGGLYLIGISAQQMEVIKALPFGNPNLCSTFIKRATQQKYEVYVLATHIDIDSEAHLQRAKEVARRVIRTDTLQ